jgi:Putative transposase, YhgA-like
MRLSPHDEFFRYLFSIADAVRAILTQFLEAEDLALLDLDGLLPDNTQYVSDELEKLFSDVVWRCPLKEPRTPKRWPPCRRFSSSIKAKSRATLMSSWPITGSRFTTSI